MIAASRLVGYPTIKFNDQWFITGAIQLVTRPYYYSELSTSGYGATGSVLQSSLNYSRVSDKGMLLVRAGEMSTVFGSFLPRYDDSDNSLVDLPLEYGYYYSPISILGLAGAEIASTRGKWDGRIQFTNSSPANPRSIFAHDQYGNWAGGGGFTIHQGFRVGLSGYRGPYLDRNSPYFKPGEANPNKLPAHAVGVDLNWARGHTTVFAEAQRFIMPYTVIPTFRESAGYVEARQVVTARWFIASRYGLASANATGRTNSLETSVGYRPDRHQLLKIGYEFQHYSFGTERDGNTLGIQLVTTFDKSVARQ
jgi:hypothetical protein